MKTIIGGSKTIQDYQTLINAIETSPFPITTVFCGLRPGPDCLGMRWAVTQKLPIRYFKPDWKLLGKPADLIKCFEMAAFAEALVCVTDGTDHVAEYQIRIAKACQCRLHVVKVERLKNTIQDYGRQISTGSS